MKSQYEVRTRTYLPRRTYTIMRLDGKAFHSFTKGFDRPYSKKLINAMDQTAIALCKNIQGCRFAYVQSDEISLLLTDFSTIDTDAWFDGQVQKMTSVSASIATAHFNLHINSERLAYFDSRVYTIADPIEVENYFVWRQKDAIRNAIQMHAQSLYSHIELACKNQIMQLEMIADKGTPHDVLPQGFRLGRFISKLDNEWKISNFNFLESRETLTAKIPKII
jgi:tRNA(His) 5'-end guanylyltransferase